MYKLINTRKIFSEESRYGFVDKYNNIIIPCVYNSVSDFHKRYLILYKNNYIIITKRFKTKYYYGYFNGIYKRCDKIVFNKFKIIYEFGAISFVKYCDINKVIDVNGYEILSYTNQSLKESKNLMVNYALNQIRIQKLKSLI